MKHTPGPWKRYGSVICGGMTTIVEVYLEENDEETEANARLITAAPELYEALKELHDAVMNGKDGLLLLTQELPAARVVLAKAEGTA